MHPNTQVPKELLPLLPKIQTEQETQRREIIENLIRYYPFIDQPEARK